MTNDWTCDSDFYSVPNVDFRSGSTRYFCSPPEGDDAIFTITIVATSGTFKKMEKWKPAQRMATYFPIF
jgi:hypothetical protein